MKTSKVLKAEYSSFLYINILIALTCLVTMFNQNVFAQSFPVKPITLVVAFPAGSSTDVMARDMAVSMANSLGQSVIVANRAGAGGVTGTDFVAKSAPDGYTLGWGTSSQLVMNPGVYKSLPFDDRCAEAYGRIRARLAEVGSIIGPNDLLIASIAVVHGATLVTHNVREFSRVEGLAYEDWEA